MKKYSIDYVNDVSALSDERIIGLLVGSHKKYILMHSLGVPVKPNVYIDANKNVMQELKQWFEIKINRLLPLGLSENQIILDPGLGFGKNAYQSIEILKNIDCLNGLKFPVMIGHSRKSFINTITPSTVSQRDAQSIAISLKMIEAGVHYLRVHKASEHCKASLCASLLS